MFETMTDRSRRIHQLFDETKWRYIWLLFGAGAFPLSVLSRLRFRFLNLRSGDRNPLRLAVLLDNRPPLRIHCLRLLEDRGW